MIDIVNLHLMGVPVLMYAMIIATTGAIAFASVYPMKASLTTGSNPEQPNAKPASSAGTEPGMPGPATGPASGPGQAPPTQGGKKYKRKTQHKKRSPKKRPSNRSIRNLKMSRN
jgi:hypothetical protein